MDRIHVIGISPGSPISTEAIRALEESKTILASRRLYDIFSQMDEGASRMKKCRIIGKVDKTISTLKRMRGEVAVLASGDPMFFGIGKRITEEVKGKVVRIYPALSSLQLAFSAAGMSWNDATLVSFHGPVKRGWSPEDLPLLCQMHPKLAMLTGGENTPSALAAHLPGGSRVWVAERLGYKDERIRKLTPSRVRKLSVKEPNIMIVLSPGPDITSPALGLMEKDFIHTGGLITKDEVRAVALHRLALPRDGVLWDIGAGSGSVGIEARRAFPSLEVYAVEKDASRAGNIVKNALKLNAGQIRVIKGMAPQALLKIPDPDRVFIGGSGAALGKVMAHALKRLNKGGVLVVTVITLESLETALGAMKKAGLKADISQLSVSRSSKAGALNYMKALNPVYILKVNK